MSNSKTHCSTVGKISSASIKWVGLVLIGAYRTIGTSHFGGACRFEPSCSQYALEALHQQPSLVALKLIIRRLIKCRPGGSFGWDPVPPSSLSSKEF